MPHGAQVRRSTGIVKNPVSSRQIRWAPRCRSFFYPGPVVLNPLAHALIVALLGPRLRPLRTEATRTEQAADVIGMVDDLELLTNQIDDPPARPQACAIAGGFRPGDDHTRESPSLRRRELRRSTGGPAGAQAGPPLSSVHPLPSRSEEHTSELQSRGQLVCRLRLEKKKI